LPDDALSDLTQEVSMRRVGALVIPLLVCTACSTDRDMSERTTAPAHALEASVTCAPGNPYALEFRQSHVEVPDSPTLDLTTSWTLEAWVYPRAAGNGVDQDIISKWDGAPDASYILQIDRTGVLRLVTNDGSTQTIVLSQGLLINNTWQHVAATFEGTGTTGTVRLYLDGALDTTVYNALTPINSTQPVAFGREGNYPGGTISG